MRGKAMFPSGRHNFGRITPAYAGKSGIFSGVLYAFEDHPRLCGEKFFSVLIERSFEGSPPPMRGKVVFSDAYDNLLKDHPRLCGEKPDKMLEIGENIGITPAYAGKSQMRLSPAFRF